MENKNSALKYPLTYRGNIFWLILFLLIWPPLGFLLLILNTSYRKNGDFYSLHYRGSKPWLHFWTIVFFPVAIILGAVKGFDLVVTETLPQ